MKKLIFLFLITLSVLLFIGCDSNALPEVSVEEAQMAFYGAIVGFEVMEDEDLSSMSGISASETFTGDSWTYTITFSNFVISETIISEIENQGITFPYTSISGTVTLTETMITDSVIIDITLTGGPVVTIYASLDSYSGSFEIEINGHNMTEELESLINSIDYY